MHRHLVAVEIRIERRTDQGMQLNGFTLDENRLEGLDPQAVQGGRPVEHHRVFLDHLVKGIPYFGNLALHHLLGAFDGGYQPLLLQPIVDEGLKKLQGHFLRQAALVQAQVRADRNNGTPRVIHPLTEEVLPKPPLLAFQGVTQ